ncbi:MAG TPA: hypothetical protein ENK32_03675 [Anaerolineae bacterium]|nr:hypothetical protein [Anaerolineae bacterium]
MSKPQEEEFELDMLSETENFAIWRSQDENGYIYHVELGSITLHLMSEEWQEFLDLIQGAE